MAFCNPEAQRGAPATPGNNAAGVSQFRIRAMAQPHPLRGIRDFQKRISGVSFILHEKEDPAGVEQRQRQRVGVARSASTKPV